MGQFFNHSGGMISHTLNIVLFALVLMAIVGLVGGYFYITRTDGTVPPPPGVAQQPVSVTDMLAKSGLKKFASIDELKAFLKEHSQDSGGFGYGGEVKTLGLGAATQDSASAPVPSAGIGSAPARPESGGGGGGVDFSQTNVQVEGVDEADLIKTDGKYAYAISGASVFILDAYPAEAAQIVGRIELPSPATNLYIKGDRLAVYGYDQVTIQQERMRLYPEIWPRPYNQFTFFKVYDISDKANPRQVRDMSFEGYFNDSRMVGDFVYFITTKQQYGYDDTIVPLPVVMQNGAPLPFAKDIYYFDMPYRSQSFVTVAAINTQDKDAPVTSEVYLMDAGQNVYMSENNLYIVSTRYVDEYQLTMDVTKEVVTPRLGAKEQDTIAKIQAADVAVLTQWEKDQKVMQVFQRFVSTLPEAERVALEKETESKLKERYTAIAKELEKTIIHKIAVSNGTLAHAAVGEVPGHVLNQFSMDEHDGYFRIATTKSRNWAPYIEESQREPYSNLYVLDGSLKVVGKLEELAPGERIYSARFMQGRAYLVTFQQTDPLFVIDVGEPTAPKVLGELKIPGFSNYLHPYDDTTLIGIGRDTEARSDGAIITKGLKISLFDVANVAQPAEVAVYKAGGSWSNSLAEYDHKAVLFAHDKNLLVIPATLAEENERNPFIGALVFDITKTSLALKGRVAHPQKQTDGYSYEEAITRSFYIENGLYTLSNTMVGINNLADLALIKNISFPTTQQMGGKSVPVPFPLSVPGTVEPSLEPSLLME